ncbi:MAG: hypothetical protein ACK2T3_17160 [Candidatus Promineifilaceae bacterium]|jgi:hypothetical protein
MPDNALLNMLSGGDLRSDGMADEVVRIVRRNPALFGDLYAGLAEEDDVVRGRTADALEKIARSRPDLFLERYHDLIHTALVDPVAMVRWHIAMILGHLAFYEKLADESFEALEKILEREKELRDNNIFTLSWTISSLTIFGRLYPELKTEAILAISELQWSDSKAILTRVRMALETLSNDSAPFPAGWSKSELINL